jgi:hypothetical protein
VHLSFRLIEKPSSNMALHRSKALEKSLIGKIPSEIMVHIAECLPTASAALFTFCCNAIKNILGTRYWRALKAEQPELDLPIFLTLLERDLPDSTFCYPCMVLHTWKLGRERARVDRLLEQRPSERYEKFRAPCFTKNVLYGSDTYIFDGFRYAYFQMAMKQYRLGRNFQIYLDQLALNLNYESQYGEMKQQCRAKVKICGGRLLVRVQEFVLIPRRNFGSIETAWAWLHICGHFGMVGEDPKVSLPEDIRAKRCLRSSGLKQCSDCPTEYRIDLQECGELGVVVIVTKWLDLGEGRTFLDPAWWSRFRGHNRIDQREFNDMEWINKRGLLAMPAPYKAGNIVGSFEKGEKEAFKFPLSEQRVRELAQSQSGPNLLFPDKRSSLS